MATTKQPTPTGEERQARESERHGGLDRFWDWRWPEIGSWSWPELTSRFPEMFESASGRCGIRVEEFEDDGMLVIRAEIPDVDPDRDIEVSVSDHRLHIRAEREQRSENEEKERYRSEFRYGSYERTMVLPPTVTEEDVEASYRDGILEVRLPIDSQKSGATKIEVSRG